MSYSLNASCSNLHREGATVYVTVSASGSSSYSGTLYINGSAVGRSWSNVNGGSGSGSSTLSWNCPGPFESRTITCRLQYQEQRGGSTGNTYKYPATGSLGAMTITGTFDYNDGSGNTDTETETYGDAWIFPSEPVRSGYKFLGWFDDPDAGNEITSSDTVSSTTNVTLYAHWEVSSILHVVDHGTVKEVTDIRLMASGVEKKIVGVYAVVDGIVRQGV